MRRALWSLAMVTAMSAAASGADGALRLRLRDRQPADEQTYRLRERKADWLPSQTAVIICDMWDQHWCRSATRRCAEVAPRIDAFARAARAKGALIIHAPSSCLEPYRDHPARRRAQMAPTAANLPNEFGKWCHSIPSEERTTYPIDQSDGGCDDQPMCPQGSPWRAQIASIRIEPEDAISDSGVEIWNLMEERGIKNVLLCGVHTNMCVLGRPFGLRNMSRAGKNTALIRDLTDTMYNPRARPMVDHFKGTELIVEHIEKHVASTITSDQLLGGKPFRFAGAK